MHLTEFNQANEAVTSQLLKQCVAIPSWVNYLLAQRPFTSTEALYHSAQAQAQDWCWSEIATALAQHPRIGERQAAVQLSNKEQQFSQQEQGQLAQDAGTAQALLEGNQHYEAKFGHIFLIRAKGRTSAEILDELQRRLDNSEQDEQIEVKQQLAEIAILRLQQEVQA